MKKNKNDIIKIISTVYIELSNLNKNVTITWISYDQWAVKNGKPECQEIIDPATKQVSNSYPVSGTYASCKMQR